ncbi:MAG: hypothetical protein JWQ25_271 [Daejeonella sp.]|nr:hypothetical protein [Daejeonella sp.]
MFTRFVAILLILSVCSSNFTRFMVVTSFKLNQKYIAVALCSNKNKPQMHCNGKCYLAKKLKQADEKEKSTEQVQKKHYQEALTITAFRLTPPLSSFTNLRSIDSDFMLSTFQSSIFQPPQA